MASPSPHSTRAGCSTAVTYTAAPANRPAATIVINMGNVTLQHLISVAWGTAHTLPFLVPPRVGSQCGETALHDPSLSTASSHGRGTRRMEILALLLTLTVAGCAFSAAPRF